MKKQEEVKAMMKHVNDAVLEEKRRLPEWYIDFVEDLKTEGNLQGLQVDKVVRETLGFETEADVAKLEMMIEASDMEKAEKAKFQRMTKIMRRRLEKKEYTAIGRLIRNLRESKGMSLRGLQDISGISSSYIHRIENGSRKTPSREIIEKIASALGEDPNTFIKLAEGKQPFMDDDHGVSVETLLFSNDIAIKGRLLEDDEKKALMDTITYLIDCEFKDKKHIESIELLNHVENFKRRQNAAMDDEGGSIVPVRRHPSPLV